MQNSKQVSGIRQFKCRGAESLQVCYSSEAPRTWSRRNLFRRLLATVRCPQGWPSRFPLIETKDGRCRYCDVAMWPHLVASGCKAGSIVARCANFWKYKNAKRICFYSSDLVSQPPKGMLAQQQGMREDIGFMLAHGPQTAKAETSIPVNDCFFWSCCLPVCERHQIETT